MEFSLEAWILCTFGLYKESSECLKVSWSPISPFAIQLLLYLSHRNICRIMLLELRKNGIRRNWRGGGGRTKRGKRKIKKCKRKKHQFCPHSTFSLKPSLVSEELTWKRPQLPHRQGLRPCGTTLWETAPWYSISWCPWLECSLNKRNKKDLSYWSIASNIYLLSNHREYIGI